MANLEGLLAYTEQVVHFTPPELGELVDHFGFPVNLAAEYVKATDADLDAKKRLESAKKALQLIDHMRSGENGLRGKIFDVLTASMLATASTLSIHLYESMPMADVPCDEAYRITAETLRGAAGPEWRSVNRLNGFADEFDCIGRTLIDADIKRNPTHGANRMPDYVDAIVNKRVNTSGVVSVKRSRNDFMRFDGAANFGQVGVQIALQEAMRRAKGRSFTVAGRNMYHAGRLEFFVRQAVQQGFLCIAMLNTGGRGRVSSYPDGLDPIMGTNPFSFGVPDGKNGIVFDMATSAQTEGLVNVCKANGLVLPMWILRGHDNRPTTNPADLYLAQNPAILLPAGAHKGTGAAEMVELMIDQTSGRQVGQSPPAKTNAFYLHLLDLKGIADIGIVAEFANKVASINTASGKPGRLPGTRGQAALEEAHRTNIVRIPLESWNAVLTLHKEHCTKA